MADGEKPVAVSAAAGGPPSGSFEVTDAPLPVVLLERRGQSARIRYGYIAGWIDGRRLSAKEPKQTQQFGMVGLLNSGAAGDPAPPSTKVSSGRRVACNGDIRLVAVQGVARFVIGTIPREKAFVISEQADDLAYLDAEGSAVELNTGVRLAVPMRDVMGCAEAAAASPDALGRWTSDAPSQPELRDAVSVLPGEFGKIEVLGARSIGEGAGFGTSADSARSKTPKVRAGAPNVSGKLAPEVISVVVRKNLGRFRTCYEQGLAKKPDLAGRVSARFVIGKDGAVSFVSNNGSSLPDQSATACVLNAFYGLSFPQPEADVVTVIFPFQFSPE